jgi:hypothetical protein
MTIQFSDFDIATRIHHKSHNETKWSDRDEHWFRTDQHYLGMIKILDLIKDGTLSDIPQSQLNHPNRASG